MRLPSGLISRLALVTGLGLAFGGCGDDKESGGSGTDGSGSDTEGSDADSDSDSQSSDSGEETDSGTGGEVPADEPARGDISISRVEANSGIAIPVLADGAWVEGQDRTAQIPKNRNTAFRVYVDVGDDWISRDIEGRFTVVLPDGSESVYRETATIAMDSSTTSLQSNLLFGVLAEDMQPGAQFQVELYEASNDASSLPAVDEAPKAMPEPNFIGIESGTQNMNIMLIPVQYSFGGCTTEFDPDEHLEKYRRQMFQQNPLETINIQIHDPLPVTDLDLTSSGDFFGFLQRIVQLRASENPPPNVYYYAIFDNCGECITTNNGGTSGGCTLGVAPGTPDASMASASARAGIGVQYLSGSEVGIDTFVHEVGHSQGRQHVFCPGSTSVGNDITFPHEDGKIGTWGFGVEDFEIRSATTHFDYMGYCNPTWVSDWQWKATYERIRTLSSWDEGDMGYPELEGAQQLVGMVNTETGESSWFTTDGGVPMESRDEFWAVDFMIGESSVLHENINVDAWSEGPWVTVRAQLTDVFDEVTTVQLHAPSFDVEVEQADVVQYHGRGFATPTE